MATLKKVDDTLELSLSGMARPDFAAGLDIAKSMPGRRFNGDKKVWEFPADPATAEKLMYSIRPAADKALLTWIKEAKAEKTKELVTPLPDDAKVYVPWRDTLFPFQRAFVNWAVSHPKIILADDMGLGKTLQALSAVAERAICEGIDNGPKLVVCPNSVKGVWGREINKWLGGDEPFVIVDGATPAKRLKQIEEAVEADGWAIVNWEQLRVGSEVKEKKIKVKLPNGSERMEKRKVTVTSLKQPIFGSTKWQAVIADECHRAKSRKSLQTQGLWKIDGDMKLALTGTPVMNSPDELWPILRWLFPDEYGKSTPSRVKKDGSVVPGTPRTAYWAFFDMYVDSYDGYKGGKVITGVRNPDALRFELAPRLVRRTKHDKLNLPEKTREIIPITLKPKQRKLYDKVEKEMWLEVIQAAKEGDKSAQKLAESVKEKKGKISLIDLPNGAVRTVRQRQVCSTPAILGADDDSAKLDAVVEIITDAQPKQFVVFSEFVDTCNIVVERLAKKDITALAFTGSLSTEERTQAEDDFQDGKIDVLVGTIAAMGEGVTLTAADTVIFIERHWTPAKNEQAEDRVWRNGQENAVTILILEAEDTVDTEKVQPTNELKSMIVKAVIHQDTIETKERGS